MTLLLTQEEIAELTQKRWRSQQAAVLRGMGIEHRIRPDGSLAVLRTHITRLFGEAANDQNRATKRTTPNLEKVA